MWTAIRIEPHHVNSLGMAHGGFTSVSRVCASAPAMQSSGIA